MKSCEMHLVLVLSDHVNVGKDPLYRPPKTQKAEEGRTTQTTVYPHVKASGKFPGKNPRAQKAHLYAFIIRKTTRLQFQNEAFQF